MFTKLIFSLAALLVFAAAATAVRADTITVVGVNSGQFSTATVVCDFDPQTNTLLFTVTNTSAITQPGSTSIIVAIAFDLPPLGSESIFSGLDDFDGFHFRSQTSNFNFRDFNVGKPPGFESAVLDFAFLTSLSGNFSFGLLEQGVPPGDSASFIVTGRHFAGFTEEQICNAIFLRFLNVPLAAGSGGADVGISTNPVPEPSSILLLGSALAGLGSFARRKMKTRN